MLLQARILIFFIALFSFNACRPKNTANQLLIAQTLKSAINTVPVGEPSTIEITEDQEAEIIVLTAFDKDFDLITYKLKNKPIFGEISDFNKTTGSLVYTPILNFNGTDQFSFIATDTYGNSEKTEITINVSSVNDLPTIQEISNQTIEEDSNPLEINLEIDEGGGSDENSQIVTIQVSSSNTNLIPNENIEIDWNDSNSLDASTLTGNLEMTPAENESGTSQITITLSDGTDSIQETFLITVNEVNDAPILSDFSDITINEDESINAVTFTVDEGLDPQEDTQNITLEVTSSDLNLIPNENIVIDYDENEDEDSLSLSPQININVEPNQNGTSIITVRATDSGTSPLFTEKTFTITVNSINDEPVLTQLQDIQINEDETSSWIPLQIDEGGGNDEDAQSITISAVSNNTNLIPNENIEIQFSDDSTQDAQLSNPMIRITPNNNINSLSDGTAQVTVNITDSDQLTTSQSFSIEVQSINDEPTISDIPDIQVNEDEVSNSISISLDEGGGDDEDSQSLTISATSSNTDLIDTNGIQISYNNDGALDATDGTFILTPKNNINGSAIITFTLQDDTNTVQKSFNYTVLNANDSPTIIGPSDITIQEDETIHNLAFSFDEGGESDEDSQTVSIEITSDNQQLIPNQNISIQNSTDGNSDASLLAPKIDIIPAANQNGTAKISISIQDNGSPNESNIHEFYININPVNDAPLASEDQFEIYKNDVLQNNLTASDIDSNNLNYTIVAQPLNGQLNLDSTTGNFTYTPNNNYTGNDEFTFKVNDGENDSSTETININVRQTWLDSNYLFRKKVTLNNLNRNSNIDYLPVLIQLTPQRIDYTHFLSQYGDDIVFADENNNIIPHEIESFQQNGTSRIWVLANNIIGNSDENHIWMYYGYSGASNIENPNSVWDTLSAQAVFHLTGNTNTSTSNLNLNATNHGASFYNGKIASGMSFSGTQKISISNNAILNQNSDYTISAWFKLNSTFNLNTNDSMIIAEKKLDSDHSFVIALSGSDNLYSSNSSHGSLVAKLVSNNSQDIFEVWTQKTEWLANTWYYFSIEISPETHPSVSTGKIYIDGVENSTNSTQVSTAQASLNFASSWYFGGESNGNASNQYRGILDEIRIQSTSFSSDWHNANYYSQNDNLCTFLSEEEE